MTFEISNIQIKNGTSEWNVKGKVKRSYVNFDLPFGIPIEPITTKIRLDSFDCAITISHYHPDPKTMQSTRFKGNAFYENDRWGRSYVTRVQTKFEHSPPIDLYSKYNDEIFFKSLEAVNRLIKVTRYVLNKFVIHKVIQEDIEWYNTKLFDENDKEMIGGIVGGSPGELKTVVGGFQITDNEKSKLLGFLNNNKEVPLYEELLRNANDYFFLGNLRAAVIECEAAFETCVIKILYAGFLNDELSNEECEKRLLCTGFFNLLKDHLNKYLKSNFYDSSSEYDNWYNKCYDIRNKLVHQGTTPKEPEVKDAILYAKNAINFLEYNKK